MATIRKAGSGRWRAQVRRRGHSCSRTFQRREDARRWALEVERQIECGEEPLAAQWARTTTFGELIDLHLEDMARLGRAPGRSKVATLGMLKQRLGDVAMRDLTRTRLVAFAHERAAEGAAPVTIGMDISFVKGVLTHAAAARGLKVSAEPVDLARHALKRMGLVARSAMRDRRPTQAEIDGICAYFEARPRELIPMSRVIRFAIATALRQGEIFRVTWRDLDASGRMLLVRDRKDPRRKRGNDHRIPLLAVSGYDAMALIEEQRAIRSKADERIFPYNHIASCHSFKRACRALGIEDLRFHDLRHEAASRLFEAGFRIEQVALVTGHKYWIQLQRYTHLRPESLHALTPLLRSA